ncbi:hypothetical protein AX16_008925 [Volvariella volvacea WC 439]|nr:hypothetical protein AX16_008925 [Volvariella volvacea WC 439]
MTDLASRHPLRRALNALKQRLSPPNATELRIKRREAAIKALSRHLTRIRFVLFVVGYLWMLLLPERNLSRFTYIDENALLPGQVCLYGKLPTLINQEGQATTRWNWADVHQADKLLEELEALRDRNASSAERADFFANTLSHIGLSSSTQSYSFKLNDDKLDGVNAYAILSSPRVSGTEAIVISASWLSRIGEGGGTLNLRGVSNVLTLAKSLKQHPMWAKDLIFVISDGYLHGMQAWLSAYYGVPQSNLVAEPLALSSGVIWTALNIDYPGHSFSHLGLFYEGLNGRLPNQDLLNSVQRISRIYTSVPVTLYDHLDAREFLARRSELEFIPQWLPQSMRDSPQIQRFAFHARNILRHTKYQVRGRPSGVHGLFHQYRVDAITLFGVPATGPHGFWAMGRIVESSLRTANNLLERLHASFFFYILAAPDRFLKIGNYLPSAITVSIAIMFGGLREWTDAAWIRIRTNSSGAGVKGTPEWTRRKRPIPYVIFLLLLTHTIGYGLFAFATSTCFLRDVTTLAPVLFVVLTVLPPALFVIFPVRDDPFTLEAPTSSLVKAFNLCLASSIISITSVLNFSLAAALAILLGIPLSVSSPSSRALPRVAKYFAYAFLGLGWLLLDHGEIKAAIHEWQLLGSWFAPFVCIVYAPLVLQAGIVCLLPY